MRQPFGLVRAHSADIRGNSGMFGGFLPRGPNGPEFARTAFGVVRVCSVRAIHRKTYCVFSQKKWMHEKSERKEKSTALSETADSGLTAHSS
jgi:hypothetical protein